MAWGGRASVSPKLLLVIGMHGVGMAVTLLIPVVNYYKEALIPMANASVYARLGMALDDGGVAWLWSITATSIGVGYILGSAVSGTLLDRFGRRFVSIVVKNMIALAASGLLLASGWLRSFEMLIMGRFLCGISGALQRTVGTYVAECAPDESRGSCSLLSSLGPMPWSVLAVMLTLPSLLGQVHLWQFYICVAIIPITLCMASVFYLHESPKYIYEKSRNEPKTARAIVFYHGKEAAVGEVLEDYEHEALYSQGKEKMATLSDIWSTLHLHRALLICVVTQVAASTSSGYIMDHYSKAILTATGLSTSHAVQVQIALLLVPMFLGLLTSLTLIEHLGRRKLMLTTIGLSFLSFICLFLNDFFEDMKRANGRGGNDGISASAVLGIQGFLLQVVAEGFGLYSLPRLIAAEVCPTFSRGKTAAVSNVIADVGGLTVVLIWPPLHQAIGAYCFLPQMTISLACFVWLFLHLPETKDRPVDKIVATFVDKYSMTQLGSMVKKHNQIHVRKGSSDDGGVVWPCMPYGNILRFCGDAQTDSIYCPACNTRFPDISILKGPPIDYVNGTNEADFSFTSKLMAKLIGWRQAVGQRKASMLSDILHLPATLRKASTGRSAKASRASKWSLQTGVFYSAKTSQVGQSNAELDEIQDHAEEACTAGETKDSSEDQVDIGANPTTTTTTTQVIIEVTEAYEQELEVWMEAEDATQTHD